MATVQGNGSIPLVALPTGFVIKFEAIDPTSGAAVSGVTVKNVTLAADQDTPIKLEVIELLPPVLAHTNGTGDNPGPRL